MAKVARITPREAHARVVAGQALLVCAYEDPARFAKVHLEGAISIQEFRARRAALPRDQEIIFYCA
jgi:rhodanese-related sulfurtransferase